MASSNPSPVQARIMTIVSCVALLVLSVAALGFFFWGIRRIFARTAQISAQLDTESGDGPRQRAALSPKSESDSPPSSDNIDPFQTPVENRNDGESPPEWAVQYQQYLNSVSARNQVQETTSLSLVCTLRGHSTHQDTYPRGLGILMEPEDSESAYSADNEDAPASTRTPNVVSHQTPHNKRQRTEGFPQRDAQPDTLRS
ncbi:hypothetical protein BDY19DRAFT_965170 [Irpex rosettiformis]|uniref:Uncharacterized protein n=1 Tax=Irpex rosettiformis TaxID=378272 RepID=A0ACB8TUQ1_9APHY|nr:hypothetical protein BDY19DRAFT_965170 [Irpex rosettiformis]